MLNHYLGTMVEIIMQYQGTIDEFIGDAIFVIFGAPMWREDDTQRAVACAVAMQLAMATVNGANSQAALPNVEMGIGVHTGEVVVGNIGSHKRTKYAVVGSHVNLTSRIQSYTIGGQILISEATRQEVESLVTISRHMEVDAKGIIEPITLYELRGIGGAYNLFLPETHEVLLPLQQELLLQYRVLEGEHLGRTVYTGRFVTVSTKGGEICSDHPALPWSNVKCGARPPWRKSSWRTLRQGLAPPPREWPRFLCAFHLPSPKRSQHFFQRLLASGAPEMLHRPRPEADGWQRRQAMGLEEHLNCGNGCVASRIEEASRRSLSPHHAGARPLSGL